MLDRGFFFSASGILTFKNSVDIRETFAKIPLDKIVIETDAPYCAPVPHRGKRNESAYIEHICRKIAELHGTTFEAIDTITTHNARQLFNI